MLGAPEEDSGDEQGRGGGGMDLYDHDRMIPEWVDTRCEKNKTKH